MTTNIYAPNPNSILIQYYIDKIRKDAEELSNKGISSKTYNREDLDCNLGMLCSILSVRYKIRNETSLTTEETITFTWK